MIIFDVVAGFILLFINYKLKIMEAYGKFDVMINIGLDITVKYPIHT